MADTGSHTRFSGVGPGGTETILVVDDERVVRDLCTAVLTQAGYKVIAAEDGYLALQMCKAAVGPVHLALLVVRMPRMSGPELIVELLDCLVPENLDIRFILMSRIPCVALGFQPRFCGGQRLEATGRALTESPSISNGGIYFFLPPSASAAASGSPAEESL